MLRQIRYALIVAGVVLIAALIYVDLPYYSPAVSNFNADNPNVYASSTIQLKDTVVRVEIADTPEERAMGLSGREGLAPDEGLLFVFEEDGLHAFWMKDMRFAIDIVWVSSDGAIVHIEENVTPETYPAAFAPRREARYVVELSAGYVAEHEVRVGDIVRL
ncbi:DUF192 domain-containing protein [Candidatus Kaiserbacteria bacterium]|nr:DUF192 domain-containing protein [Candidatus Kaiserbacteria bacterium]